MALTKLQRKVVTALLAGGSVRKHITPNDILCWRLLDREFRPVGNIPLFTVSALLGKGYLERTVNGIHPCAGVYQSKTGRIYRRAINQSINLIYLKIKKVA